MTARKPILRDYSPIGRTAAMTETLLTVLSTEDKAVYTDRNVVHLVGFNTQYDTS